MVLVDMNLPDRCFDCPCSYWIRSGPNEGRLMCNVMEANRAFNSLVDENRESRPSDCPMREVEVPYVFRSVHRCIDAGDG